MSTDMESVFRIGKQASVLPAGYIQLEYIDNNGTAYLDLGKSIGTSDKFILDISWNNWQPGSFFGSYDSGGTWQTKSFTMGYTGNVTNGQKQFVPSVGEGIKTAYLSLNRKYRIEWKGINANPTVDGTDCTVTISKPFPDYTPSVNTYLCTRNQAGSAGVIDDVNIYYMKVEGKLELIPAKRNSDNVIGMYDTVSNTFFTNSGTGSFTAGPVVEVCKISQNNQTIWERAISLESDKDSEVTFRSTRNESKNLFDKNNLPERIYAYFMSSGTTWTYVTAGYSLRFPCLPNTTYTARYNGNSTQAVLSFASTSSDTVPTSDQTTVTVTQAIRQNSPTISTPVTLTTGANDKWLIVQYNIAEPQHTDMADNLQIEQGSTATSYQPYWNTLPELNAYGKTEQLSTPTPDNPIDIVSNNGAIKCGQYGKNLFDSDIFLGVTDWQKNGDEYFGDMGKLFNKYFTSGMVSFNGKPNTQYTFSYNIKMDGTIYGGRARIIYSDNSYTDLTAYLSTDKPNYKKITGTSENGKTIVGIKFPYTAGEGNAYFKEFMIEEGTTITPYEPYHFGLYTEGTQEKITVSGKNIWNLGDFTPSTSSSRTLEGLDPNKTYSISILASSDFATTSPNGWSVSPRNADGSSRGNVFYMRDYVAGQMVSTQFSGASMLRIQAAGLTGSLSPMLTEGSVAPTSYEPYYAPQSVLATMLNKIGNYQDIQNIVNGSVSKNVGIKVLDGTENDWRLYANGKFALPLIGSKKKDNQEPPFCSHFIGISGDNVPTIDGRVSVFNASIAPTSGGLGINHQATQELEQFKQWLASEYAKGTPVIVVYPLATTTTESVAAQDIDINKGTYTAEVTEASLADLDISVKYLGNE